MRGALGLGPLLALAGLLAQAGGAAAADLAVSVSVANAPPRVLEAGWAVRGGALVAWAEVEDLNGALDVRRAVLRADGQEAPGQAVARPGVHARVEAPAPQGARLAGATLVVTDTAGATGEAKLPAPPAMAPPPAPPRAAPPPPPAASAATALAGAVGALASLLGFGR